MEDWEEFFLEKSRRRAEKERLREQRQKRDAAIAAVIGVALVLGLIAGLALAAR
ncbi:MAG TPA: hypothetical protein VM308_09270 [Sphingomicrobium sp.]|nr:hypothetical protein [Sphingomicrobium sp.]